MFGAWRTWPAGDYVAAGNVEDRSLCEIWVSARPETKSQKASAFAYTEKKMQTVSEKTAHGLAERGRRQHMRCQRRQAFAMLCRRTLFTLSPSRVMLVYRLGLSGHGFATQAASFMVAA